MELHFVLVSDERYARGLAVTLRSLLDSLTVDSTEGNKAETLHAARVLHVWLLDTGLSDETWARLRRMVQDHSTVTCSVNLHRIPAGAAVTLPAWDRSTSTSRIISTRGTACISLDTQASAPGARTAAAAAAAAAALCPGDNRSLEGVTYVLPPCDSYASQSCWLKLLLPELLPPDVKYALYLDCDMLVKEDPCTLLDGAHKTFEAAPSALLAAVRDFGLPYGQEGLLLHPSAAPGSLQELEQQQQQQGQQQQQQQVLGPDSTYFNAGLLLYNMPAWRQHCETVKAELLQLGFRVLTAGQTAAGTNCDSALRADNPHKPFGPKLGGGSSATGCSSDQIVPICSNGGSKSSTISTKPALRYHDQDALNLLCCNTSGWQELDHRWNVQGIGTYLTDLTKPTAPHQPPLFTPAAAAALEASPAIVHFTGPPNVTPSQLLNPYVRQPSKPWALVCLNRYAQDWYTVLHSTEWAGWRPEQRGFEEAAAEELVKLCRMLQPGFEAETAGVTERVVAQPVAGLQGVRCTGGFDSRAFLERVAEGLRCAAKQLS